MKGILKLVTSYIRFHAKKTVRTAAGIAAAYFTTTTCCVYSWINGSLNFSVTILS